MDKKYAKTGGWKGLLLIIVFVLGLTFKLLCWPELPLHVNFHQFQSVSMLWNCGWRALNFFSIYV